MASDNKSLEINRLDKEDRPTYQIYSGEALIIEFSQKTLKSLQSMRPQPDGIYINWPLSMRANIESRPRHRRGPEDQTADPSAERRAPALDGFQETSC